MASNQSGKKESLTKKKVVLESSRGRFKGDVKDGKFVTGEFSYRNGNVYTGSWKNQKRHGKGIMKYHNGNVYDGDWENGKKHGVGRSTYSKSGNVYFGDFVGGKKHGFAKFFRFVNIGLYKGYYRNDKREGFGTMTYKNKDFFSGNWKRDMKDGQGKFKFHKGDWYEGTYRENKKHGHGTFFFAKNGNKYVGNFEVDKMSGKGKMNYGNGDVYEGEWRNDLRHGQGKLVYHGEQVRGDVFEGLFQNGKINGRGKYTYQCDEAVRGDQLEGDFGEDGVMKDGLGLYRWSDGTTVYEGDFVGGKMHGQGRLLEGERWFDVECVNGEIVSKKGEEKMNVQTGRDEAVDALLDEEEDSDEEEEDGEGEEGEVEMKKDPPKILPEEDSNVKGEEEDGEDDPLKLRPEGPPQDANVEGESEGEGDSNVSLGVEVEMKKDQPKIIEEDEEEDEGEDEDEVGTPNTPLTTAGGELEVEMEKDPPKIMEEKIEESERTMKMITEMKQLKQKQKQEVLEEKRSFAKPKKMEMEEKRMQEDNSAKKPSPYKKRAENKMEQKSRNERDKLELFLEKNGFGQYTEKFKENHISFEDLKFLQEEDMEGVIEKAFHRRRFFHQVQSLPEQPPNNPEVIPTQDLVTSPSNKGLKKKAVRPGAKAHMKVKYGEIVMSVFDIPLDYSNEELIGRVLQAFVKCEIKLPRDKKVLARDLKSFTLKDWWEENFKQEGDEVRAILRVIGRNVFMNDARARDEMREKERRWEKEREELLKKIEKLELEVKNTNKKM